MTGVILPASDIQAFAGITTGGGSSGGGAVDPTPTPPLDFTHSPELFSWSLGLVMVGLVLGFVIGSIIRVVRSA
jgi:hypothetical protein